MIFLPLKAPILSFKSISSPFMTNFEGMLPWIRAFIYEHTFSRNGRMEEKGAIGASLMVDLNVFLFGRMTSIGVEIDIISGETTGLGNALMIVSCKFLIICSLLLISLIPSINFFYSTCFMEVYNCSIFCLYWSKAYSHISKILYVMVYLLFRWEP